MTPKLPQPAAEWVRQEAYNTLKSGEPWEAENKHFPVGALVSAMLEIDGLERKPLDEPEYGIDGFSTNGWQWDWWQEFSYKGKNYTLSGSGYYGGHTFTISDDV